MNPFGEGRDDDVVDEITLRASTIAEGTLYYEEYIITTGIDRTPIDVVSESLRSRLIEKINNNTSKE
jgi:hypothetical protein